MPADFILSRTETIKRSPALNLPSSQSAPPRRADSCFNRARRRSATKGRRSGVQGLSPSKSLALASSRMAGSTVLTAANIHVIARARARWDRLAAGQHGAQRCGGQSPRSRIVRGRLAQRLEFDRKDEWPDAPAPSSPGKKQGVPRRGGPLLQEPSERAYRAQVPFRHQVNVQTR